jgi:sugar/nucleoside kinase (ribokinase family)
LKPIGSFVGLATLDMIYLVDRPLGPNEKQRALRSTISAGGPAANAAVAFAALGGEAHLFSAFGTGQLSSIARAELESRGVAVHDGREVSGSVPISSILVQQSSGEGAVVSINDQAASAAGIADEMVSIVERSSVLLIDGHHPNLALSAAKAAHQANCPVEFDGGSWKASTEALVALVDFAICSNDFVPHDYDGDVLEWLINASVPYAAVTNGDKAVQWRMKSDHGEVAIAANTRAVDTLGAGDIFHGAFAYATATCEPTSDCRTVAPRDFANRLKFSADVATQSCRYFGTRGWLDHVDEIRPTP